VDATLRTEILNVIRLFNEFLGELKKFIVFTGSHREIDMATLTGNGVVVLGIFTLCENSLAEACAWSHYNFNCSFNNLVIIQSTEVFLS